MNKHFKSLSAIVMALLLGLALIGCSLVSVNDEKDMAQVVAKVGDVEITKQEFVDEFTYYISMYRSFGYDPTATQEDLTTFQDSILDGLISMKVQNYQAAKQGYTELSAEELTEIAGYVEEAEKTIADAALSQAQAEFEEDPDIDVNARAEELFPIIAEQYVGKEMSREELKTWLEEQYKSSYLTGKMQEDFYAAVTVTDEEVRAAFDEQLASDKTTIEGDAGKYKGLQESFEMYGGTPPLFAPEGYVRVKHILLAPEEELGTDYTDKVTQMSELQAELGQLTLDDEAKNAARIADIKTEHAALKAETEQLYTEHFAQSKQDAQAAYDKLQSGASFDEVMKEYTQDADFTDAEYKFSETGKLLSKNTSTTDWSDAVKDAVLALTTAGSYTGVIEDDSGYHILQYVGDEPAGERAYADYEASIREETLSAKQEEEWNALVTEWTQDTTVVTRYPERIRDVTGS